MLITELLAFDAELLTEAKKKKKTKKRKPRIPNVYNSTRPGGFLWAGGGYGSLYSSEGSGESEGGGDGGGGGE